MGSAFGLVALVCAAAGAVALLEAVIRRTPLGVGLVLAALLGGSLVDVPAIALGPFNVVVYDLVFALLAAAGVARLLRSRTIGWQHAVVLLLFGLFAISIARGAGPYGLDSALNEGRRFLYFFAGALYCSTVSLRTASRAVLDRLGWLLVAAGIAVVVFAVVRWGALAVGYQDAVWARSDEGGLRVLGAPWALLLVQVLFLTVSAWHRDRGQVMLRNTAAALLAVVVLLQHRTVWVVLILGAALLLARRPELARRFAVLAAGGAITVSVLLFTVLGGDGPTVGEQLADSATNPHTFEWRVEGWRQLVFERGPQAPVEILLGQPFGSGFEREINGTLVTASPHSFYVETYTRLGVAGLAALLALYAGALVALLRRRDGVDEPNLLTRDLLGLLLATQLVYFLTYHAALEQGILLGLAIGAAHAVTARDARSAAEHPTLVAVR